jgi:V8-like Glu-specific endopeptidase
MSPRAGAYEECRVGMEGDVVRRWLRKDRLLFALGLPMALATASATSAAQPAASSVVAAAAARNGGSLWTPERLLNAGPADPAVPAGFAAAPLAGSPAAPEKPEGGSGHAPTVWVPPLPDDLVNGPVALENLKPTTQVKNAALGGGVFTESRVIPPNTGQSAPAVNAYPYSGAGKLLFHDPRTGQDRVCSAAVDIGPRAILTAAHCVAHGSPFAGERYYYTDFKFIPAYNNGEAPYGTWKTDYHFVPNAWLFSGGVPNPEDFALLEAVDQGGKTLGSVVGWLGWQTHRLRLNQFTTLGYPCNLDSCVLMQRNDAPTLTYGGNNTWIEGSDMGAGAGGGPWVQDFGLKPNGAPAVPFGGNIVVGVTSYTGTGFLGASQFDQTFTAMRNAYCARQSGNCPPPG